MAIRPVFDPAIPVEVRDALAGLGDQLPPYPGAPLARELPGWWRQARRDAVRAIALGAVCALLPAVLAFTRMFGWAGKMAALAAQIVLLAVWFTSLRLDGLWVAITVSGSVQVLSMAAAFRWMDAWQLRRGVRRARGHYLLHSEFGPESREILARAQAAIGAVTGSAVAAAGLLDNDANDVVLARQEWEIAQALARRAGRDGGNTGPGGQAVLAARRVGALESYAEQVREADAALAERHAAGLASAGSPESVALAEIDDLADSARRVADAIREVADAPGPVPGGTPEPRPGKGPRPGTG